MLNAERLRKLEKDFFGEQEKPIFITLKEVVFGEPDRLTHEADNNGKVTTYDRAPDETQEAFCQRVHTLAVKNYPFAKYHVFAEHVKGVKS